MKKAKYIVVFAIAWTLAGCGGPRIIPDRELARIFHDVYLTNAYSEVNPAKFDSISIYEPIFARYGYTSEDVQFTIGSFAKRKSARLSEDVVQPAIDMLNKESEFYSRRIAVADTIAQIARRQYAREVYTDSLITVRRISDTSRLRITMPVKTGDYEISYSYLVDSTDTSNSLRTNTYFMDMGGRRVGNSPSRLRRGERGKIKTTLTATDAYRSMVIDLNGYTDGTSAPNFRIDSLVVKYYLPDRVAVDSMSRSYFGLDTLFKFHKFHETHIVTPLIDTVGTASR